MKYLAALIAFVALSATATDQDWKITPEHRKQCAEAGGCLLTLPEGRLIPMQTLREAMLEAYNAGVEAGKKKAKTCGKNDV